MGERLLLLGLDGADPKYLPVYFPSEFKVKPIESPVPSSGPAWTSIYTGKTVREHGVTHIWGLKIGGSKRLSDIEHRPFWEKLPVKVGIFNAPVIYPPRPVNGFILSGFPIAMDTRPICHPEGLVDENYWKNWVMDIAQYGGFDERVEVWWRRFSQLEGAPVSSLPIPMSTKAKTITRSMDDKQLDVLKRLLDRYPDTRFLFAQFSHIDRLFHLWGVNPDGVKFAYDEARRLLDRVKTVYAPDKTFIVSDHGFLEGIGHGNRRVAVFAYDGEPKVMPRQVKDIHNTILGEYI